MGPIRLIFTAWFTISHQVGLERFQHNGKTATIVISIASMQDDGIGQSTKHVCVNPWQWNHCVWSCSSTQQECKFRTILDLLSHSNIRCLKSDISTCEVRYYIHSFYDCVLNVCSTHWGQNRIATSNIGFQKIYMPISSILLTANAWTK